MRFDIERQKCSAGGFDIKINLHFATEDELVTDKMSIEINMNELAESQEHEDNSKLLQRMEDYVRLYNQKDYRMMRACIKKFRAFIESIDQSTGILTKESCRQFWMYLCEQLNGNTPANYFKKFRTVIQWLVSEGIITDDPTVGIKLSYSDFRQKDTLSNKELAHLMQAKDRYGDIQKAFLFSCFTGLRWCDVVSLRYEDIDIKSRTMTIVQKKVRGHSSHAKLCTYLNKGALSQLNKKTHTGLVFNLQSYSASKKQLQRWIDECEIGKHITFHCARHTFVTNLVALGVDMKTIADLAGHSSIKHTERYAHADISHLRKAISVLDAVVRQ